MLGKIVADDILFSYPAMLYRWGIMVSVWSFVCLSVHPSDIRMSVHPSVVCPSVFFLFPDDKFNKYQWIFTWYVH